jgi:D-glycero-alpha-D-manno-heptose 1-phosphate guanylyltransferase
MSERVDAIILAGGLGTRLAPVLSDLPKALAPIGQRAFLDYLIDFVAASGQVDRIILALGHLAHRIEEHLVQHKLPLPILAVTEPSPLGTGGAARNALLAAETETVLILNGDTLVGLSLADLLNHHHYHGNRMTLAAVPVDDAARFGSIIVDGQRVTGFAEKQPGAGLINAGIYAASRSAFDICIAGPASLERDFMPELVKSGTLGAFVSAAPFIDIGLPETYQAAASFIERYH